MNVVPGTSSDCLKCPLEPSSAGLNRGSQREGRLSSNMFRCVCRNYYQICRLTDERWREEVKSEGGEEANGC